MCSEGTGSLQPFRSEKMKLKPQKLLKRELWKHIAIKHYKQSVENNQNNFCIKIKIIHYRSQAYLNKVYKTYIYL